MEVCTLSPYPEQKGEQLAPRNHVSTIPNGQQAVLLANKLYYLKNFQPSPLSGCIVMQHAADPGSLLAPLELPSGPCSPAGWPLLRCSQSKRTWHLRASRIPESHHRLRGGVSRFILYLRRTGLVIGPLGMSIGRMMCLGRVSGVSGSVCIY